MTILAFIILGCLIALGTAPQAILTLVMAAFWYAGAYPPIYLLPAMWVALWAANMPGLALSAVSGIADWNANQINDWAEKFKPSWWVMKRFINIGVDNPAILGAIGTATRYLLFIPAIAIVKLSMLPVFEITWIMSGKIVIIGIIMAILAGFIHWLSGRVLRGTDYAGYAVMIAEGLSAGIVCGGMIV